jgi:hypothetical protein
MLGQLIKKKDGSLQCNFANRMVLMANHQVIQVLLRSNKNTDESSYTQTGYTSGGSPTLTTCTASSTSF